MIEFRIIGQDEFSSLSSEDQKKVLFLVERMIVGGERLIGLLLFNHEIGPHCIRYTFNQEPTTKAELQQREINNNPSFDPQYWVDMANRAGKAKQP